MKKVILLTCFLFQLFAIHLQAQQLTYRFSNSEISNDPAALHFDVDVKANEKGTFQRDLQIYIDYNTNAFYQNIVSGNHIQITALELMSDQYQVVNLVDNSNSKIAIITEGLNEMTQPGGVDFFNEITTVFQGLFHVEILIADPEQLAGIAFDKILMNGGQYYQDENQPIPLPYLDPNLYENDLLDFPLNAQTLEIPQGWSGISSYINPYPGDVESMFYHVIDELVILQNESGMYWPSQNLNTLGDWNTHAGYKIKVSENCDLTIVGEIETDKTIALDEGWNLIPVISECEADVEDLFTDTDLTIVKEVAGWNIYWPTYGINTLEFVEPGKAYFVLMDEDAEITFPDCDAMKSSRIRANTMHIPDGYEFSKTPNNHVIAIRKDALDELNLAGEIHIVAKNKNGKDCGVLVWEHQNSALTLFGDDPYTDQKDGIAEGEKISLFIVNPDTNEEVPFAPIWDMTLPQHDGKFSTNGISAIKAIDLTGIDNLSDLGDQILVFPNPARDELNVFIPIPAFGTITIMDIKGQKIYSKITSQNQNTIDVSSLEKGIYLIDVSSEKLRKTIKFVKE